MARHRVVRRAHVTVSLCAAIGRTHLPLRTSHSRTCTPSPHQYLHAQAHADRVLTVSSYDALAITLPLGLQLADTTNPLCPTREDNSRHVSTSHTLTV